MDGICSACRQAAVQRPRVLCLQWADPAYTAGAWVADMLSALPILNVMGFNHDAEPVEPETVANLQPDAVIFSICGLRVSGATQHVQGVRSRLSSLRYMHACRLRAPAWTAVDVVSAADALWGKPGGMLQLMRHLICGHPAVDHEGLERSRAAGRLQVARHLRYGRL